MKNVGIPTFFKPSPSLFGRIGRFVGTLRKHIPRHRGVQGTSCDTPMKRLGCSQAVRTGGFDPDCRVCSAWKGGRTTLLSEGWNGDWASANSTPANASEAKRSMECRPGWPRYSDGWPIGKDPADSLVSANMVALAIRSFFPPRM